MNTPLFFYRDVLSLKSNKRSKNVLKSMGTCYNYRINTQEIPVLFHVQLKFNDTPSNDLTSLHSPAHNQKFSLGGSRAHALPDIHGEERARAVEH